MDSTFRVRLISLEDTQAALEVYKPYVTSTAITFDYDVPTVEEFAHKIESIINDYPWIVCEYKGRIIGYAYGSRHRAKTAYQWSPESTIYVALDYHGGGIGRLLYQTLFALLKLQGYVNVYAGVLIPNEKSVRLHESLGFEKVGVFRNIGYKLGQWHSTQWYQLPLAEPADEPALPKPMAEIMGTDEYNLIFENANRQLLQAQRR